ncbi:hypothetical protein Fmac_025457 [Flemingia macrophylla]|uniref:C2 domain-containing protein n=1 Tax=Flemingia macrophylla TaxID=520843 RepID=A0ABD1LSC2_9FABA
MLYFEKIGELKMLRASDSLEICYLGEDLMLLSRLEESEIPKKEEHMQEELWRQFQHLQPWTPNVLIGDFVSVDKEMRTFKMLNLAKVLIKTTKAQPVQECTKIKINEVVVIVKMFQEIPWPVMECQDVIGSEEDKYDSQEFQTFQVSHVGGIESNATSKAIPKTKGRPIWKEKVEVRVRLEDAQSQSNAIDGISHSHELKLVVGMEYEDGNKEELVKALLGFNDDV